MDKIDLFPTGKSKAKRYKYMTNIGCHDDESELMTHRLGGEIVKAKLAGVLVSYVTVHLLAPPPSLSCLLDIGGYSPLIFCCHVK